MKRTREEYDNGEITLGELALSNIDRFLQSHKIRINEIVPFRQRGREFSYMFSVDAYVEDNDWYDFTHFIYESNEFKSAFERYIRLHFKNVHRLYKNKAHDEGTISFILKKNLLKEDGYTDEIVEILKKCESKSYAKVDIEEELSDNCILYYHDSYRDLYEYIEENELDKNELEILYENSVARSQRGGDSFPKMEDWLAANPGKTVLDYNNAKAAFDEQNK